MKHIYFLLLCCAALLTSCSRSEENQIQYVPYQASEGGLWGLISPSGEVLCERAFTSAPTVVRDGIFLVKDKDGYWRYYKVINKKIASVGEKYIKATTFNNGVALVVAPNKPVTLINTDFETVKVLDKLEGKKVKNVQHFVDGYAIFSVEGGMGVIDENGDVVIKPTYSIIEGGRSGIFYALDLPKTDTASAEEQSEEVEEDGEEEYSAEEFMCKIINAKGEVLGTTKYQYLHADSNTKGPEDIGYVDSLAIAFNTGEAYQYNDGVINTKGQFVVTPKENVSSILQLRHGMYVFYDEEHGMGVNLIDGTPVKEPGNDMISILSDDRLACGTENKELEEDFSEDETTQEGFSAEHVYQYYLTDMSGNPINDASYLHMEAYDRFDGKHTFVKTEKYKWSIINKEGNALEDIPAIFNISLGEADLVLSPDLVEMPAVIKALNITENSIVGLSLPLTPARAIQVLECPVKDPASYIKTNAINTKVYFDNIEAYVEVAYDKRLAIEKFSTTQIVDSVFAGGYQYHDLKTSLGCTWATPLLSKAIVIIFDNGGALRGRLNKLKNAIVAEMKKHGQVIQEEQGYALVKLGSQRAIVFMDPNHVTIVYGTLRTSEATLEQFKQVEEKPYYYEGITPTNQHLFY